MIKKILLVLAAIVGIILIVAAFQPASYRVERKATVAAPPSVVFTQVNDFHGWEAFNPWLDLDTTARITYEGPSSGAGASCAWAGNSQMGKGRMTIVESHPYEHIKIDMEFIEPFAGQAVTEFTFEPQDNGTEVTWSMIGENNFLGKIMCLFMPMDKMIGGQYEKGFDRMKEVLDGKAGGTGSTESVFTRELNAPREAVWNAWTKPEDHMQWWGPRLYTCPVAKIDGRAGGTYHVAMRSPEGQDFWTTGTYTEFVPMERMVYSVQFADSTGKVIQASQLGMPGHWPEAVMTTLTLEEAEGRTRLTLVEVGVPAEMRAMSEAGMNECLDKLAEFLAKPKQAV